MNKNTKETTNYIRMNIATVAHFVCFFMFSLLMLIKHGILLNKHTNIYISYVYIFQ